MKQFISAKRLKPRTIRGEKRSTFWDQPSSRFACGDLRQSKRSTIPAQRRNRRLVSKRNADPPPDELNMELTIKPVQIKGQGIEVLTFSGRKSPRNRGIEGSKRRVKVRETRIGKDRRVEGRGYLLLRWPSLRT